MMVVMAMASPYDGDTAGGNLASVRQKLMAYDCVVPSHLSMYRYFDAGPAPCLALVVHDFVLACLFLATRSLVACFRISRMDVLGSHIFG